MATPGILSDEVVQFVVDNCKLSASELKPLLKEKYGVDISITGILYHLKKAREVADAETSEAYAEVQRIIAGRLSKHTDPMLSIMEEEIYRIHRIIKSEDPEYVIPPDSTWLKNRDDLEIAKSKSHWWMTNYERLLFDAIKTYLSFRPAVQELDLNINSSASKIEDILKEYLSE